MYNGLNYGYGDQPTGMVGGTGYNLSGGTGAPQMGGGISGAGGQAGGGGFNWGTVGTIMNGLGSLGQLWGAFQQQKLAREQFDFQKKAYKTNMRNQTQTYNTGLADRINARYHMEGRSDQADGYIRENSLRT